MAVTDSIGVMAMVQSGEQQWAGCTGGGLVMEVVIVMHYYSGYTCQ